MKTAILAIAALAIAVPAHAQSAQEIAEAALEAAPVWDGHNDTPGRLRSGQGNVLEGFDFNQTEMQTDLERLARGRVGAQFWSVYVSADIEEPQAVLMTLEQIDVLKRLVAQNPDRLAMAFTAADVEREMSRGRIASLMGIEGGHQIGGSLGVLRQMYALGVRYMTLTHYRNNAWADSADDKAEHDGLTDFGRDVVREMNRLGMVVDLSHVSAATMRDTLDVASAPVIFSHSNARAVVDESRNVPDDVLVRLKDNGGIVMVTGVSDFVSEGRRHWLANRLAERARLDWLYQDDPAQIERGMAAWLEANPEVRVTVSELADHVDHVREVAGIDHIGIGGDYDGWMSFPIGMEDVAGYPALFVELARRGYSQADLEKISSGNMMRVFKAVEDRAAGMRSMAPVEVPVS